MGENQTVKVGDKIRVTMGRFAGNNGEVTYVRDDGSITADLGGGGFSYFVYLGKGEYIVDNSKSIEDLIANLAQEVVKLRKELDASRKQVDSNTRYIRTISEKVAGLSGDVEMLIDDVVTLDERMADAELDTNFTVKEGVDVEKLAAEIARTIEKEIAKGTVVYERNH